MSRTATQLAGNASSIFQAWLDLKHQAAGNTRSDASKGAAPAHSPTLVTRSRSNPE